MRRLLVFALLAGGCQCQPPVTVDDAGPGDPCAPNPCTQAHRTTCQSPQGVAECRCDPGFEEVAGQCSAVTTCETDTCRGHGTCSIGSAGPQCACSLGWAGTFCEGCNPDAGYFDDGHGRCTLDPCDPNPCTADPARELCTVVNHLATCQCSAGTHDDGGTCVADTVCTGTSCSGHGTCTTQGTGISCTCNTGWSGGRCDLCDSVNGYHSDGAGSCTTDACLPSPCTDPHRTVCVNQGGITRCDCDPGYHPDTNACVIDEVCAPSTCGAHGTCSVVSGRTRCTCDAGWSGGACESCATGYHSDGAGGCTTDVCLPNPCTAPNQHVCVAMGATPTCQCDPGTHGDGTGGCTTDSCLPNPCAAMNQACRAVDAGYQCYVPPCDDLNPCTDDAVDGGTCQHVTRANGSSCSTDICLVGQTCSAGVCGGGSARGCDDLNPCTRDSCVSPTGCASVNDDTLVPPDDGIACTVEACVAGASRHTPADARCDDGLYCDGTEACSPGPGASDAGCRTTSVPVPPGPSSPCAAYVCNESTDMFVLMTSSAGASCNDGIACTTGDVCDSNAVCSGTVTASCGPPSATCSSTTPLQSTVDIGVAPITGTITMNGMLLPLTTDNYENGVLWARATDTGKLHRLRLIDWAQGSYPSYTRSAASNTLNTTLVPGIYDILYQRAYQTSGDYVEERLLSPGLDPVVNGYRVLMTSVVIPAGGRRLDVDIGVTTITGTITQGGAPLPLTTVNYENGVIWARTTDTGKLHRLRLINWAQGSYPNYTRSAGSDLINTTLIPGTYDLVYQRAYQSSGDYVEERLMSPSADPVVNGYRVLQTGVVVAGASQTINVDIGVTTVTGTITQGGAPLPLTTDNYENGVVWARATDTGKLHRLRLINWAQGSYPSYTRSAGSDLINTTLIPGTYDIVYQRAYQSSGDYVEERLMSPSADPVVNGYRVVQTGVVVSGASQVINVDIGVTTVTGTITQGGAPLPLTTVNYENGVVWARAADTGKLHRLRLINWAQGSYPNYTRSAGTDVINTTLIPGTYDIVYQRAYQSSGDYVEERQMSPSPDPVVNGYRVVQTGVVVSGASQVINVDIGATTITGTITLNGGLLPLTTDNYENGVIWARAADTGKLHRLRLIDWAQGSYPSYTRSAASNTINTTLVPGTYDILYQRAYQSSGNYVEERLLTPSPDPVVNGYRVLQTGVVVSGAAQTIDVDIRAVNVGGTITMSGAALPFTTDNYENGVIWARARDTGRLHRVRLINWAQGSYPNYTRSAGTDVIDTTLIPGAYDLLYQRAYQSSGDYVEERLLTPTADPVVNGYRLLRQCVLIQ